MVLASRPPISRADRTARHTHSGAVVWLTGLSASGKTTVAGELERALFDRHVDAFVLDGDNIRQGLSRDLGFSADDRRENIRRIAEVARLFAEAGLVAVTAFISPYAADRDHARRIVEGPTATGGLPFLEVYVDAPLSVCEARDPNGLYKKARSGSITHFTGVTDPYEPPARPDVVLHTDRDGIDTCLDHVLARLLPAIGR
jgi:adenylyl-sulfate kinase